MRLNGLFCVASVEGSHCEIDKLLRMEDGKVNDIEGQTCKTWLSVSEQRGWLVGAGTSWRRVFVDFEMSMGRQFL